MRGDVFDPLAVDEDRPAVTQRMEILGSGPKRAGDVGS
jgi:hypothetical protein